MNQLRPPWEPPKEDLKPTPEIEHLAAHPPLDSDPVEVEAVPVRAIYLRAGDHLEKMRPQDRLLRETFVSEYMFDYNPVSAAFRTGFKGQAAKTAAKRLMAEPGVQRLIRERMQRISIESELSAGRIVSGLLKEAHREGFGSSHAARVAAWNSLAKIVMPDEDQSTTITVPGGVMILPASQSVDSWEASAKPAQAQLKHDVKD